MTDDKLERVRDACAELARTDEEVTFTAVAEATGISRATLYRNRDLRQIVEGYRDPTGQALTLTGLATRIEQLADSLEAVADLARRHEERLRRLEKKTSPD
jgi:DNA-binding IclR family transcriptional regulator